MSAGKKSAASTGDSAISLRHLNYRKKLADNGGKLDAPGFAELIVIGSGGRGTPKSLLLNTDHTKYIFNCGEGTQRIAMEHKMKLSRVEHVFITHSTWDNIGGLMGMCLTLENLGVPKVVLHGPPKLESHVTSARNFAQLRSLEVEKREISEGKFSDFAMQVDFVPIESSKNSAGSFNTSMPKRRRLSESCDVQNMSIAYICQLKPKLRALLLERCVELHVPVGPMLKILKEGREVTLDDGTVVKPCDVLAPQEPNSPFIVVECPSEDYLEPLVTNDTLASYQTGMEPVSLIVHFTPSIVLRTPRYQAWMSQFGPTTQHLILNGDCSELVFVGVYELQTRLNLLHKEIFPVLPHQSSSGSHTSEVESIAVDCSNVVLAETNLRFILRPDGKFDRDQCLKLDDESFLSEVHANVDFKQELQSLQSCLTSKQKVVTEASGVYPEILFLGTGSAMPNKVRNVSAVWLNLSNDTSMLLDCGENTFGQLYRHYGKERIFEMMCRLRAVFVSHLHADHHLGVVGLALERHKILTENGMKSVEPLTVLAAGPLQDWHNNINSDLIPISSLVRIQQISCLYPFNRVPENDDYSRLINLLGLKQMQAVRVLHRQFPHAVILEHVDGWKLAYSGDTMPCPDLVKAGEGCTILIHEATMEDDLEKDAESKRHSTTSQAINVGLQMNAQFILLTHFSQRYAKVPLFNENFSNRVGIAFDNMRVRRCDLDVLPLFTPALKALFAEDYAEMKEKTNKKKRKWIDVSKAPEKKWVNVSTTSKVVEKLSSESTAAEANSSDSSSSGSVNKSEKCSANV